MLTLSRPWVKKSWKIKRKAISKLVLSIMITYERISVYLCVDMTVCNLLVFRLLLLHLRSYGNKLYIKRFLSPLGVSETFLDQDEAFVRDISPNNWTPPFQNVFIYHDRKLKFVVKNCSYKMGYNDMNMYELTFLSRNIYASVVFFVGSGRYHRVNI